jgi:hypothetical protein
MVDMDTVLVIEIIFTGLLVLALVAISFVSVVVLKNLFKGQN